VYDGHVAGSPALIEYRIIFIKSGGGTGPLKPGNRGHAAVLIPAGGSLADGEIVLIFAKPLRRRGFLLFWF
jgi:hypothetical protein